MRMTYTDRDCGYEGHYCREGVVRFISRYRNENDYCVSGHRVTLRDDGSFVGDDKERLAVAAFLLNEYADYCDWHSDAKLGVDLAPIDPKVCAISKAS